MYPSKPVRMLVGFPPGGPTDITARIAAEHLSSALRQQVIVDNRPGAGGTLAATLLASAAPDGYTVSLCANGEMAIAPNLRDTLPYDPLRSFAPVSRIGASQLVLVVHPSVPARSVRDLVTLAKSKPGSINFASAGAGSTAHLAAELLKTMAGIEIVHVPYKGAGPALSELMGGQVQMLITGFSGALPHIKSGKLRALAVTGAARLATMPDLPTIGEAVTGYEVTSWYGIIAPAATSRTIVARLQREIAAMVRKPEVGEKLAGLGIEPEGNTSQEFAAQIKQEIAKWGKVIQVAGVPRQ
ncbi:MAG: tripartite tricarboxylate transporter substrate binding protein [Betaproteobacteria bacterium]|nr:tripartite tricarboxylate transporter substrate binding protein [Betaproteobacteria bacterium]